LQNLLGAISGLIEVAGVADFIMLHPKEADRLRDARHFADYSHSNNKGQMVLDCFVYRINNRCIYWQSLISEIIKRWAQQKLKQF
jgi:hypothetical protein